MKLAILAALGLAVAVSGKKSSKGMSTKGKSSKSKLKRQSKRRPATTFKSASASGLTAQTTEHTTSYESYYSSSYSYEQHDTNIAVTTEEVDDFKTQANAIGDDLLWDGMDFLIQYMKYMELVESSQIEFESTAYTLTEKWDRMVIQMTEAEQVERDFVTDVTNTQAKCQVARNELHSIEERYNVTYTEYQTALIQYQAMMKDKLHEYRGTWMNKMSEQEVYFKLQPLATALNWDMEPWEESSGACVDDVFFNSPSSELMITLTDPYIGRSECANLCKANTLCAAFSAEHNDSDTGQCIMHLDGPGVYTGDGPRDPGWHCHVNLSREADHKETWPEYPDDYSLMGSSEEPDDEESNAAQLLAMINYMEMLV